MKEAKIKYLKHFPIEPYVAFVFFGIIVARLDRKPLTSKVKNHENVHILQGRELSWIVFYLLYGMQWILKSIYYFNFNKAYRNISFEKEAYMMESYLNYSNVRPKFAYKLINHVYVCRFNIVQNDIEFFTKNKTWTNDWRKAHKYKDLCEVPTHLKVLANDYVDIIELKLKNLSNDKT